MRSGTMSYASNLPTRLLFWGCPRRARQLKWATAGQTKAAPAMHSHNPFSGFYMCAFFCLQGRWRRLKAQQLNQSTSLTEAETTHYGQCRYATQSSILILNFPHLQCMASQSCLVSSSRAFSVFLPLPIVAQLRGRYSPSLALIREDVSVWAGVL